MEKYELRKVCPGWVRSKGIIWNLVLRLQRVLTDADFMLAAAGVTDGWALEFASAELKADEFVARLKGSG